MLKGGVIMDVVTPEQARIAEDAGAVAVMALERVPADIRAEGGVARMSDPDLIQGIIDTNKKEIRLAYSDVEVNTGGYRLPARLASTAYLRGGS
jgi:hypothetical protein